MARLANLCSSLTSSPQYTLMRGLARFRAARASVTWMRGLSQRRSLQRYLEELDERRSKSIFQHIDEADFVDNLRRDGLAFGINLPDWTVENIRNWAAKNYCYADRNEKLGFKFEDHSAVGKILGKPVLLSQYFNTLDGCREILNISRDPVLLSIAAAYLKAVPTFVGANLWWTFPVDALEADRAKHAQVFHRDVDDFKFFKFFFYLTDVSPGEGAHVAVKGSHLSPPKTRALDPWVIRRYTDREIANYYHAGAINEICGNAGEGFAEDTLCVHKGSTPKSAPRLLLQLQYALFDHGVMHDRRDPDALKQLDLGRLQVHE